MEQITCDLIPGGKMPLLHASQYDEGREYRINLTENKQAYTLDGTELLSISVRKGDNTLFTADIANTFGGKSYVDFVSTEQMCACAGFSFGELSIEKNNTRIGTVNFMLVCEPSPEASGLTSESEINNLNRQIDDHIDEVLPEQIAEEVPQAVDDYIGDNYYDKTAVDEIARGKADATATSEALGQLTEAVRGKASASEVESIDKTLSSVIGTGIVENKQSTVAPTWVTNAFIKSDLSTSANNTFEYCSFACNAGDRLHINIYTGLQAPAYIIVKNGVVVDYDDYSDSIKEFNFYKDIDENCTIYVNNCVSLMANPIIEKEGYIIGEAITEQFEDINKSLSDIINSGVIEDNVTPVAPAWVTNAFIKSDLSTSANNLFEYCSFACNAGDRLHINIYTGLQAPAYIIVVNGSVKEYDTYTSSIKAFNFVKDITEDCTIYVNNCVSMLANPVIEKINGYKPADTSVIHSILYGKSIYISGDSIAQGAGSGGVAFGDLLAEKYSMVKTKNAVSGATICENNGLDQRSSICTLITTGLLERFDYLIFNGFFNDYAADRSIGSLSTTPSVPFTPNPDGDTMIGALEKIFQYVMEHYPTTKIYFVAVHKALTLPLHPNNLGKTMTDYYEAAIEACQRYGVEVIDIWKNGGFNTYFDSMKTYTGSSDGIHPTVDGYKNYYMPLIEWEMNK